MTIKGNMKKPLLLCVIVLLSVLNLIYPINAFESSIQKTLYLIPVKGTIDLGLSAFIRRAAASARDNQADAVIFDIDTFGGRVDAAGEIAATIEGLAPIPTYAYVRTTAWSAGALIALSCKSIVMQHSASIGSAEPRLMGISSEAQPADEKMISALRAQFKATAEANGHSANLAQAMVDKDIELIQADTNNETRIFTREEFETQKNQPDKKEFTNVTVICPGGKLLNLTAEEALSLNLASVLVNTEKELTAFIVRQLTGNAAEKFSIVAPVPSWSENLVRFLTDPIVSSLLLSLGFLGLIFELKIPGWGISGTLGVLCIILFFWGHYLAGMANWLDIFIFAVGIILVVIEILFIPGFGVFGLTGIACVLVGLVLTMIKYPLTFPSLQLYRALSIIVYAFLIACAGTFLFFKLFPHTPIWKRIRLEAREMKTAGFHAPDLSKNISVGTIGISKTMLRPSGRAEFGSTVLGVTTFGEFIPQGKKIKVARIEGTTIIVELIKEA